MRNVKGPEMAEVMKLNAILEELEGKIEQARHNIADSIAVLKNPTEYSKGLRGIFGYGPMREKLRDIPRWIVSAKDLLEQVRTELERNEPRNERTLIDIAHKANAVRTEYHSLPVRPVAKLSRLATVLTERPFEWFGNAFKSIKTTVDTGAERAWNFLTYPVDKVHDKLAFSSYT